MNSENGVPAPNYTQTPNALFTLMADMGECELRVTLAVARKTFGWHKERDTISLTQLEKMTGLSRQGVIDGIEQGMKRGILERIPSGNSFAYSMIVNDVDQPEDSQPSRPKMVKHVDQQQPEIVNVVDTQKKGFKESKKSVGAKSAPHANKEKPTARRQNATVSPQAQERIEQARSALEEFGRKNDIEIAAAAAIASPVESERVFVRRVAPMIAALFPQRDLISEDRVAAKRIYALRADEEWLAERLKAYANGQGDEFRHPAKDGQQPNSFWVWKRLEKEWSIYRKEKADAEQRQAERERYERECAAAIAYAQQQNICLSGSDAQSDSVHLSGADGRTGGPSTGDKPEDGITVAAARELQVRGNGVGLSDVSKRDVGDGSGQGETHEQCRSVRELYRDFKKRRSVETLDGRVQKHGRAAA